MTSESRPEVEIRPFRACDMKNMHITLIYSRIAKIFPSFMKSGSMNTMVTSDFSPEVVIGPFCACATKKPFIYSRIAKIISSQRKLGSRNTMVTSDFRPEVEIRPFRACAMHPAIININNWNSSFIMDVPMGQMPRSTERISSI